MVPQVETERLILRGYGREDYPAFAEIWRDERVVAPLGVAPLGEDEAWGRFCRYVGHWELLGFGTWAVTEKQSGAIVGEMGLFDFRRDLGPAYAGDPEQGWLMSVAAQGQGYATEAAHAALAWGERHFAAFNPFCIISPENAPSLRVAAKVGYRETTRTLFKGAAAIILRLAR
ncbi:MAG: GNAT family N-acetyltransferase [Hyphomonadaceae bacterium]|nr:GNAT family N-acetyltransferase [Hyphomonadaceae bacterium]